MLFAGLRVESAQKPPNNQLSFGGNKPRLCLRIIGVVRGITTVGWFVKSHALYSWTN